MAIIRCLKFIYAEKKLFFEIFIQILFSWIMLIEILALELKMKGLKTWYCETHDYVFTSRKGSHKDGCEIRIL